MNKIQYLGIEIHEEDPSFVDDFSRSLLDGFYTREGETVPQAFARAATAFCYGDYGLAQRIYNYVYSNWFMYASPVLSNAPAGEWQPSKAPPQEGAWHNQVFFPKEKIVGLPISCFAFQVPDTAKGQVETIQELATLSMSGGGTGAHNGIRGTSDKAPGPIPYEKVLDASIGYFRQGRCYMPDVEILTTLGWKQFQNLQGNEVVASVTDEGELVFTQPQEFVKERHVGNMIRVYNKNRGLDLSVTPDHSMIIQRRRGKKPGITGVWQPELIKVRAADLPRHSDARMLTTCTPTQVKEESLSAEERLRIAFQADGYNAASSGENPAGKSGLEFHFSKERKIVRMRGILTEGGYTFSEKVSSDGTTKFYVNKVPHMDKHFRWVDLSALTPGKAAAFLRELSEWDSRKNREDTFSYMTTVKECADTVQAIAAIAGKACRVSSQDRSQDNRKTLYTAYFSNTPYITTQDVNTEEFHYEGDVYCVTVPSGKIMVRSNGVMLMCGNTRKGALAYYMNVDHPDIVEHIRFRVPGGDSKRRSDNRTQFHTAVNLTNEFIDAVLNDKDFDLKCPHSGKVFETVKARSIWEEILETRALTGEPFLMKIDLANERMPQTQKDLGLRIQGSNLCLRGDTHVLTHEYGLVEISKLAETGEVFHVLNGEKNWAPATAFKSGRKKLLRMTLKNGQYAELSGDHIVEERVVFGEKNRLHRYQETPAEEMLGKKVTPMLGSGNWIGEEPFSEDMAVFLGLLQGDGTFHRDKDGNVDYVMFKVPSEPEFSDFLKGKASSLGYEYSECAGGAISIRYRFIKDVVESFGFCLDTLPNRVAPKGAFTLSPRLMRAFLRGVFSANGCAMPEHSRIALTTTCKGLSEDLQKMLIALGYPAYLTDSDEQTIEWHNGTYTSLPNRIVAIGSAWGYNQFQEEIGFIHQHKTATPVVWDGRVTSTVRATEVESLVDIGEHDVYDFTEPETHWGWMNGIKLHNCSEITLPTDELRTFVCCLSSLNLAKYEEWKDTPIVEDLIRFLDNVLQFFIDHAPDALSKAKYSAERERALGLGTFGWHSLLQSKMIPFSGGGFGSAIQLTHQVYGGIKAKAVESSKQLAKERGEAPDMVGTGMRNSRLLAIAPNANSADIAHSSPSIEMWYRNVFVKDTRAGSFIVKNPELQKVLAAKGMDTPEVWSAINADDGSVQKLDCLSDHEKLVFLTAMEEDQHWVIEQADQRGRYICQAQSLNVYFPPGVSRKYVNSVHLKFLRSPDVVTMYYYRTEKTGKVDMVKEVERKALSDWKPSGNEVDCVACQG